MSVAEKPSPLAKMAVGGLLLGSGALVVYNLFFRPKPTIQVTLNSNPIRTIILIDDKYEVATPKTIKLTKGKHKFSAVSISPNLLLTYGFHKWTVNGTSASYKPTTEINVTQPITITAKFLVTESGIAPIIVV